MDTITQKITLSFIAGIKLHSDLHNNNSLLYQNDELAHTFALMLSITSFASALYIEKKTIKQSINEGFISHASAVCGYFTAKIIDINVNAGHNIHQTYN